MNLLSKGFPKLHSWQLKIYGYFFNKKLARTARFLRKHKLYPVNLTGELLDIWEGKK